MIRLNKFLAAAGIGARRKCDDYIVAGRVQINGEVVKKLGVQINELSDIVSFDGKQVILKTDYLYLMLNKPTGIVSTVSDELQRPTVLDLIPLEERIYPVGRLDQESTGLVFLTNDGELANKLIHPRYKIPKTYHVLLDRVIRPKDAYHFERGLMLD
jgi:23S rRNA pseudouridine2605 synthase